MNDNYYSHDHKHKLKCFLKLYIIFLIFIVYRAGEKKINMEDRERDRRQREMMVIPSTRLWIYLYNIICRI